MVTVVLNPSSYEILERPRAQVSEPDGGPLQVGFDDTDGSTRRIVLRKQRGSHNSLRVWRHILGPDYAGRIGALFDYTPPRESTPVRARRVSPIRNVIMGNERDVSFEVEFEHHRTHD